MATNSRRHPGQSTVKDMVASITSSAPNGVVPAAFVASQPVVEDYVRRVNEWARGTPPPNVRYTVEEMLTDAEQQVAAAETP